MAKRSITQTTPHQAYGLSIVFYGKYFDETPTTSPPAGAPDMTGRLKSVIFDQCLVISENGAT